MEVDLVQEHVPGLDRDPLADITTADAVSRGPTALAHVLAPTVAAPRLGDIRPRPCSPTSNPSPVTTAIATPRLADAIATAVAEEEDLVTRGSARALGRAPALRSRQTGSGRERGSGRETETAAPLTFRPRNTNTSVGVTVETGGRGRGLAPMTGRERGSAATRANTTAAAGTQDTAVTGAETHSHTHTLTHTLPTDEPWGR